MMNKRKMISGGFIQGIEQEEIEEQISDEKKLDKNRNEKKICAECGDILKSRAKFCTNCGTEVQEKEKLQLEREKNSSKVNLFINNTFLLRIV